MTDPYVLIAFAVILLFIAGAAFRRIDWFVAVAASIGVVVLLVAFGHWPR